MTLGTLIEEEDRWLVPMAGWTVTQCRIDYAFSILVADDPGVSYEVRIGQPFMLAGEDDETILDPEGNPVLMAPALRVLRQVIKRATAFKDGRLELKFGDGTTLRVPVCESYEPWKIVSSPGLLIVSLPGGELAIWKPEDGSATETGRGA